MVEIKRFCKNMITTIVGNTLNLYDIEKLKGNIISFDIFDTLIVRMCNKPTDVFSFVQYRFNSLYPSDTIDNFCSIRVSSEHDTRNTIKNHEVTIDDIYDKVSNIIGVDKARVLKKLEIEVELEICKPNSTPVTLFNKLIAQGYKVILISDMYLPKDILQKILSKCGVEGFEEIYVSCEWGCSKYTGQLYKKVIQSQNIKPHMLVHIGDNLVGDYYKARKNGINAILYRRVQAYNYQFFNKHTLFNNKEWLQANLLNNFICKNDYKKSVSYDVGYQVLGPMLLGYCFWLKKECEKYDIKKIFFLSREGAILKDGFCNLINVEDYEIEYINISRIAVIRALAITTTNFDELLDLFKSVLKDVKTLEQLIDVLGLLDCKNDIYNAVGYTGDIDYDLIDEDVLYYSIMRFGKAFYSLQNKLFQEYIYGKAGNSSKIAIVDIGWLGTMQRYISHILPKVSLYGFYFAVSDFYDNEVFSKYTREGYVCNYDEWNTKAKFIRFSLSVIESLFMNNEGSTLGYSQGKWGVEPVKDTTEIDSNFLYEVKETQIGALAFVSSISDLYQCFFDEVEPKVATSIYKEFAIFPNDFSILFFENRKFLDGKKINTIISKHSLIFYLFHFRKFMKDFENSVSKVIWLKSVFKLNFPYYKFLIFLTEKVGLKSRYKRKIENSES